MGVVRKVIGVVLLILGIPILGAGIAAAVIVGPDDVAHTGPHRLTTAGVAVVTTPEVLAYVGPTMHLTVSSTSGDPVFLGIGPEVDVDSYLADASRRQISDLVLPWKVTSAETGTATDTLAAPGEQTWWLKSVSGAGERTIVWPIPDGRYEIVAMNADGSPGVAVDATLGLEVGGAFYTTLAVAAFGLLLLLLGLLLLLWRRLRRRRNRPATAAMPVATVPPAAGATAASAYVDDSTAVATPAPVVPTAPDPAAHYSPADTVDDTAVVAAYEDPPPRRVNHPLFDDLLPQAEAENSRGGPPEAPSPPETR